MIPCLDGHWSVRAGPFSGRLGLAGTVEPFHFKVTWEVRHMLLILGRESAQHSLTLRPSLELRGALQRPHAAPEGASWLFCRMFHAACLGPSCSVLFSGTFREHTSEKSTMQMEAALPAPHLFAVMDPTRHGNLRSGFFVSQGPQTT